MKYFLLLFLLIIFSCNENNKESRLNGFDVSPDAKVLVFSYKSDSLYTIFTKNIITGETKLVYKGDGNYINPMFSDNGKTIIFLHYDVNSLTPEFYFYDISSKTILKKIMIDNGFISDYTLPVDNKIYYIQAQDFDSYSPIAPKSYHNCDIYELDLKSFEKRKISDYKAYYMSEIINYENDSLIVSMQGQVNDSGLFLFAKTHKPDTIVLANRIVIKNDTLRNSTMYTNPVVLSKYNILCSSSYQMVKLDLKNNTEQPFLPSTGYHYKLIRKAKNLIFYQRQDHTDYIYYFDLNMKKLNSVLLKP